MDFCLYLITDRHATAGGRTLEYVLESAFSAGVKGVLLREKDLPERELLGLAGRVRDLTLRHRVRMLVSSRVDVALAVDADGVHISGASLPVASARELVGVEKYVAVSTHSVEEAVAAEEAGADFITFGPVFHTASKEKYGPPVGIDALGEVCRKIRIPVFALGGIKEDNVLDALCSGAYGVAVISAVVSAEDPAAAAKAIMEKIRAYKLGKCI